MNVSYVIWLPLNALGKGKYSLFKLLFTCIGEADMVVYVRLVGFRRVIFKGGFKSNQALLVTLSRKIDQSELLEHL